MAGALLSGLPSTIAWALGRAEPVAATREIGRVLTGRPSLMAGAVGHLAASTIFAVPAPRLARAVRSPLLAGVAYGAALYALDFGLLAPRLWPGLRRFGGAPQMADHIVYGAVVVALAARESGAASPG